MILSPLILFILRAYVFFMAGFFIYCLIRVPTTSQYIARLRRTGTSRRQRPRSRPEQPRVRSSFDEDDPWVQSAREAMPQLTERASGARRRCGEEAT